MTVLNEEETIACIRMILDDDTNYQTGALKLGGIWDLCDKIATYRRLRNGDTVEVILKKFNTTTVVEPDPVFYRCEKCSTKAVSETDWVCRACGFYQDDI